MRPVLAFAAVMACRAAPGGAGEGDSSTGPRDQPAPNFIEPAGGELHLDIDRTVDVTLDVSVVLGVTRVELDGDSVGSLTTASRVGAMSDGSLRLFTIGAMTAGHHTLQLRTPDEVSSESSEVVDVFLEAVDSPVLAWSEGEELARGEALLRAGAADAGVLALRSDDAVGTTVTLLAATADGWDSTRTRTLGLPGKVMPGSDAIAVQLRDDGAVVRAAWVVDAPASALAVITLAWDEPGAPSPIPAMIPDPSWLGGYEWASVAAPTWVGDHLLAEVLAAVDVEQAHAGDRVIGHVRIDGDGMPAAPRKLSLPAVDHDGLVSVVDPLAERAGIDAIGLRRGGRTPIVLELDRAAGTFAARVPAVVDDAAWSQVQPPLSTVAGAFGSRTVAALGIDGASLQLSWLDDRGGNPGAHAVATFPDDGPASAAPAAVLVGGVVVWLVPRGEAEVLAITGTEGIAAVQPLAGAHCDAIAGPRPRADAPQDAVTLACLRGGSLWRVALSRP